MNRTICLRTVLAISILFTMNVRADEKQEVISQDGVRLVWQHIGERVAYLAYSVKSSESGIFELYWTCNGIRDDSRQTKHSGGKGNATYIVNTLPNGIVEDTANVIVEKLPLLENNQMAILATIDWTEGEKQENYAGESSMTAFTPELVKSRYMNFQKVLKPINVFNKLPADQPFKLFIFNLEATGEKPEIWELCGNWLSQDKLIKEYNETKSQRSLFWLLADVIRNDMKSEDVEKILGPATKPDEKTDRVLRKGCEKQGFSLQENDVFVIYDAHWIGVDLQFRNGKLINHSPEEYADPRVHWTIQIQPSVK